LPSMFRRTSTARASWFITAWQGAHSGICMKQVTREEISCNKHNNFFSSNVQKEF
jgi:hypothetical protein